MLNCTCDFCKAGKLAMGRKAVEYRKPRPAIENDELTAALQNMTKSAAHNYRNKKDVTNE